MAKHDREGISARTRYDILRRCNFACFYCGTPAALGLKKLQIDHVMPVALGGTNDPWNLVAACYDCNAGKGSTPPTDEIATRARGDYCAYVIAGDVEAQPCRWCGMPVLREFPDDEEPLTPESECSTCNQVWHDGYQTGRSVESALAQGR